MKIYLLTLFLIMPLIPVRVFAEYPSALANHNLKEALAEDRNRLIPNSDFFALGVDGTSWYRKLGPAQDFYHGFGYWLQARSEVTPDPHYRLNARTIFYSGSSSEGYANPTGFYNLIAISGEVPGRFLEGIVSARVGDLERQTIGQGLLIQDREMNGAILLFDWNDIRFRLLADSTGSLVFDDDVGNFEISLWQDALSLGAVVWSSSTMIAPQQNGRDTEIYLTSKRSFATFGYQVEIGNRGGIFAGLLALTAKVDTGAISLRGKLEGRDYNAGFGKGFVGQIEPQYISYDQYDKAYTNPMNMFVISDDLSVYSLEMNLSFRLSDLWRFYLQSEVGSFAYRNYTIQNYNFHRAGVMISPFSTRDDGIEFFISNKALNESYKRPPTDVSHANTPLFKTFNYAGIEANYRF